MSDPYLHWMETSGGGNVRMWVLLRPINHQHLRLGQHECAKRNVHSCAGYRCRFGTGPAGHDILTSFGSERDMMGSVQGVVGWGYGMVDRESSALGSRLYIWGLDTRLQIVTIVS